MVEILKLITTSEYESLKSLLSELYPNNKLLERETLEKVLSSNTVSVFVAREKKQIIGMGSLAYYLKLGGKVCVIEDVIVHSTYQGKGVGRLLVNALVDEAIKKGASFIDVSTRRQEAREFYLKCGFTDKSKDRPFLLLRLQEH